MGQLNFAETWHGIGANIFIASNGTLSFCPFNLFDSISFNTINWAITLSNTAVTRSYTFSIGLYSLNGSSLSLANSLSRSITIAGGSSRLYVSASDTSATQNITPGTWYFGLLASTGGHSHIALFGQSTLDPGNNFPGSFIGGRMTDSTNALPSSYATSDLDILGSDALVVPMIILSA